jgi:hypothetical protein
MSINNATPADWDRLRKQHPPVEAPKRTIEEPLMQVYLDMADAELNSFDDDDEQDAVAKPYHYNTGNIECIEAIEESMSEFAFKGYLKGNCMKYLWRYDYKGKPVEDLQKAQWYLARLLGEVVFDNEEDD